MLYVASSPVKNSRALTRMAKSQSAMTEYFNSRCSFSFTYEAGKNFFFRKVFRIKYSDIDKFSLVVYLLERWARTGLVLLRSVL